MVPVPSMSLLPWQKCQSLCQTPHREACPAPSVEKHSGKKFCLSIACSGSKPGDDFCDTASKGEIKNMLLAKAESFSSNPKALPGLQM